MRRNVVKLVGRLAAPLFVALVLASAVAVQAPGRDTVDLPGTQEVLGVQGQVHYLPFAAPQFLAMLRGEHGSDLPSAFGTVTSPVRLITSVVSALDGNDVYVDHWEDGYDLDPIASPGGTTEHFAMDEGDTQVFDNWVDTGSVSTIDYDGGDRIVSTGALVITAGGWPTGAATLHANAAVVPDVDDYGFDFTAPVGENVFAPAASAGAGMWEYTGFLVIAAEDDTHVDVDGAASFDLDAGESHLVDGDVDMGEGVHADKPVLVYLATGDQQPSSTSYEGRIYRLTPTERWSDRYMTPVGGRDTGSNATRVFLYNPSGSAISVDYTESGGATGTISVPADGQASHELPTNGGATYSSPGNPFYALQAITTPDGATDNSATFNWGLALTPMDALTPMVVVGYGPGSDGLTANDSAVYVSAVAPTTLYVDLDGNRATGANTDGNGNGYDFTCSVAANTPVVIKDVGATSTCSSITAYTRAAGTGDNDMTGARIYTTDGVSIAAAWGQVPGAATAASPAIDMGTTVLPFPTIDLSKDAEILGDAGDGEAEPGDTIRYTITVTNRGISPVDDLVVNDQVPAHTTYIEGSTVANGGAVTDPTTGTAFPLDEGGLLVPPVLNPSETRTVVYDLLVDDPLPPGVTEILNEITLESDYGTYTDSNVQPVADPGTIGDRVWDDTDGDGTQDGGEPGLTGITVDLLNGNDEVVATTTTGSDGAYTFTDVYPGDYVVRVGTGSLPAGMTGTHDLDGTSTPDEAAVTLAAAQTRTDVDFGYVAASISLTKTVVEGHDGEACAANTDDVVTGETTDDVTWCFVVTNTGPIGLMDVTVDDPDLGIDQDGMTLEAGDPDSLAAGASVVWSHEGDITGALVNEATATAHLSPGGPSRTATDTAEVQVLGPGISLDKSAYRGHDDGASCNGTGDVTVEQGGPLTYCFEITNAGQTNLSAVTFSDPALGIAEGDHVHALLAPDESHTFHVEVTAAEDLVNTATATGTSPAGVQPEATDTVDVDVVHPGIQLEKSIHAGHDGGAGCADGEEDLVARTGDAVTWCFEVTNSGDTDLSDLTVDDLPLEVDESDLEGVVPGLTPGGTATLYLETTATADVANEASVGGQPPVGPPVSADDTASLDVIHPSIEVDKTVYPGHDGGVGCTGDDGIDARPGDEVTWCFEVTNTGDDPLSGVTVDDLDLDDSGLTLTSGSLDPLGVGETAILHLEATVDGDLENTVSVTGTPTVGDDVTGEDTATTDEVHPELSIEKTVYGGHDDGAQCDTAGDLHHDEDDTPDTWCFTITNEGDVPLSDVRVDDPLLEVDQSGLSPLSGSLDTLDPQDSVVLYLEDTLTDDLQNTAIATATPPVGDDVTDADTASVEVQVPSVELEKTVYPGHDGGASCDDGEESIIARQDDQVTWCLLVRNTGDTDVYTTVADAELGLSQPVDLGPGQSTTIHVEDTVTEDLPNTATVSGTSPGGHAVEDSDGASVDVVHPEITLAKTVYGGHDGGAGCDGATSGPYANEAGHDVTWCFLVTNEGDVPVTDISVDDLDLDDSGLTLLAGSLDELAPDESVQLYLEGEIGGDLTNHATTTAVPPVGPDVTADAEATVELLEPAVSVAKTVYRGSDEGASCASEGADSIVARPGAAIVWCFLVRNDGETDLTVTVADEDLPEYPGDVLQLGPGESETVWHAGTVDGDLDNTVSVLGETPDHDTVDATDDASVTEIHPALAVEKTVYSGHDDGAGCGGADVLDAEVDEEVTWCFRIENTGDVELIGLHLDDDELGLTEAGVQTLEGADFTSLPAGGVLWAYVEDVVEVAVANDVTVTGTATDGDDVTDTDTAHLEVVGPEIGIAKKLVQAPTSNGDGSYSLTYRLRVTNSGETRLDGLQVVDDLSVTFAGADGFVVEDVSTSDLTLNPGYDGGPGDAELLDGSDTLPAGQSADIVLTVSVTPGADLGPYLNTATATGTSPVGVVVDDDSDSGTDPDPGATNPDEPGDTNGSDDPVPVTFPAVDLVIRKGVQDTRVEGAIGIADWRIRVANLGPGDDPGPITVTDALDERLALVSASGDGWDCGNEGQLVTCTWDEPLLAGEQTTDISIITETELLRTEDIANAAHVQSTAGEDRIDNNDSAAEVTAWVDEQGVPSSTLPRTGATIGGLVLLGLGLVLGGRLLQRRSRAVPA